MATSMSASCSWRWRSSLPRQGTVSCVRLMEAGDDVLASYVYNV